ncbi:MAG: epoxyqueuosine reductase QueH [Patescibacteria group bacterium]|nr:epoxyqueuosine reductase QueH [Patescibacteria group bacterium]
MSNTGKPKLLLHICCVGCGVYASQLLKQAYEVTLFFYNPNIWPEGEYLKRLEETKKIAGAFNLRLMAGDYEHGRWLEAVRGHEGDQERGERCLICYRFRLEQACKMAQQLPCAYLTTTLTTSPHKDAAAINKIGRELAAVHGLKFLEQDFKKQDGFKKSSALSRELSLYRQNYCGCEFSKSRSL